jgi:hypothetical protein
VSATWRGEGIEIHPQPVGHLVGDPSEHVGHAVSTWPEGQPGLAARAPLLVTQQPLLVTLGHVRRDHLQHPAAEDAQRARREVTGVGQQLGAGLGRQLRIQVVGEVVQRRDDHRRLGGVQEAFTQRPPYLTPARQALRQPLGTYAARRTCPRLLREPHAGRPRAPLLRHVIRRREQLQAQTLEPRQLALDRQ